ncbi:sulfotransferase [uncultured Sphingomonas sp.]|uniref:tetratricopeptide repeat-containing sulfotransferase family protein n=1 Tax=uncultured Sphingomonas sp. TaxID=158754 RepID=UPI0035CB61E9
MRLDLAAALDDAQRQPLLVAAAAAMQRGEIAVAERALRERLRAAPTDIAAIRMLAEVAGRIGRYGDAETLLARALELAPDFDAARANYVTVLHRQSKFAAAHAEADRLIANDPAHVGHLAVKAAVLVRTGGYRAAIGIYEEILGRHPDQPRLWVSYGHVLKTVARQDDAIAAYRRAIDLAPTLGDAWWSIANLKIVGLGREDIAAMLEALPQAVRPEDRYHLHFALGKALEDMRDYAASFEHYALGNSLRRAELRYDAGQATGHLAATRMLMTSEAFKDRAGSGDPAADPIFVVGLPRAGSTLIEQILASHSKVEGTMELPDIGSIAADLTGRHDPGRDPAHASYLHGLLALSRDELATLGRRYLDGTRIQRKSARPLFVDKMPNNFAHVGLIHLILPNATIIDARRHPMATGFSAFKQHFSRGQGFTYDLGELGRYYREYVEMMAHYDIVLPGRVHRIDHEALVGDAPGEIRKLLAHCRLDFEPACLAFHKTERAVRTASSEQVRRPLSSDGIDQWRNFEPWLGPLREALGDAVACVEAGP